MKQFLLADIKITDSGLMQKITVLIKAGSISTLQVDLEKKFNNSVAGRNIKSYVVIGDHHQSQSHSVPRQSINQRLRSQQFPKPPTRSQPREILSSPTRTYIPRVLEHSRIQSPRK